MPDFLRKLLGKFETILYVLGNHESYRATYTLTIKRLENFEADITREQSEGSNLGQFVFLNRKAWLPSSSPDLVVLGCTQLNPDDLDILSWSMTIELYDELRVRDCRWLVGELKRLASEPDTKVVVLTHHAPIVEGASDPKFSHPNNPTLSSFVTDKLAPAAGVDFARKRGVLLGPLYIPGPSDTRTGVVISRSSDIRYGSGMQDRALSFNREIFLEL